MGTILSVVSIFTDTTDSYLSGISDMEIAFIDGVPILYVGSEAESALTSFSLTAPSDPVEVSQITYSVDSGTRVLTDIEIYERNGITYAVTLGRYDDNYGLYQLDSAGNITFDRSLEDGDGLLEMGLVSEMINTTGSQILATSKLGSSGMRFFRIEPDETFVALRPVYDKGDYSFGDVVAMTSSFLFGETVLITASALDAGIHVVSVSGSGKASNLFQYLPTEGTGFSAISDLQLVEVKGKTFLVVASAGTHSLHVLKMSEDHSLGETDSYIDTAETRFAGITTMEVFQSGGRTFVVAAGRDEGLTVFELNFKGQLVLLDVILDDFDITLANISDIEVLVEDEVAHIFASSSQDHGFTVIDMDLVRSGVEKFGNKNSNFIKGTTGDDVIWGKRAADTLKGKQGKDRLVDGMGKDHLYGGSGKDIFEFTDDNKTDWIEDFQPGLDRVDMSNYSNLWHISSFNIFDSSNGKVVVQIGDELLKISPKGSLEFEASMLTQDDFIFG